MLIALVLTLVVNAAPDAGAARPVPGKSAKGKVARKGPTAYDTALLYFLAGDLPKAQDWAKRGLEREKARCLPLHQHLAEYAYLFGADELTRDQARELVALDRKISPTVPSKLTEKVLGAHVTQPLQLAQARATAGDARGAKALAERALFVDPQSAEAKALLASLAAPDAGR